MSTTPKAKTILVVDDDPAITASLALLVRQHGFSARTAATPADALAALDELGAEAGLVLQDMNFSRDTSGREGLELLREIRRLAPDVPVILVTAWGSIGLAVEGMKAGAADFVTKPWSNALLLQSIETALSLSSLSSSSSAAAASSAASLSAPRSRQDLDEELDLADLVGADPAFLAVLEMVARVAPTDASVLVTGESGTGKELIAAALHRNSRRRGGPFVKVNLGGISSTLFESEMFGHVRGAFTDAREARRGRFEIADGGTIFLDEIGEVDPPAQVKLLRVLQDRTFEVLGSSATRTVDVRVISATNRDLAAEVARGAFREDLFYRLNLIALRMPSLRERPSDIPLLSRHFLSQFGAAYGRRLELTDRAVRWLAAQPWPGNVRQLRQTLERAVVVGHAERIDDGDLARLAALEPGGGARGQALRGQALPAPGAMTLDELERAMVSRALEQFGGNMSRAADALGLSRAALYRRLRKHGL